MRQAKMGAALARSLPPFPAPVPLPRITDRLRPGDLDLNAGARSVWRTLLDGVTVIKRFGATPVYRRIAKLTRHDERCCPLESLAELLVWCANRGIPEDRVRLVLTWLDTQIAACYAGTAHPDLDAVDLEEQTLDNLEDTLSWGRRIRQAQGIPCTRDQLEDEALVNQRQAAISLTRARELLRRARLAPRVTSPEVTC